MLPSSSWIRVHWSCTFWFLSGSLGPQNLQQRNELLNQLSVLCKRLDPFQCGPSSPSFSLTKPQIPGLLGKITNFATFKLLSERSKCRFRSLQSTEIFLYDHFRCRKNNFTKLPFPYQKALLVGHQVLPKMSSIRSTRFVASRPPKKHSNFMEFGVRSRHLRFSLALWTYWHCYVVQSAPMIYRCENGWISWVDVDRKWGNQESRC